ncbi:MAG: hypothetical protein JXR48_03865 [Candidatus Delongbacteria bacterium]|nr:hypothetical protein [Candidatus Delongbacteria bacterium]MBN2834083.1 hypothetical protein [Candidatus Delongbacteria bacterium]
MQILKSTDADRHKFFTLANIGAILQYLGDSQSAYVYFKKAESKIDKLNREIYKISLTRLFFDIAKTSKALSKVKSFNKYIGLTRELATLENDKIMLDEIEKLVRLK